MPLMIETLAAGLLFIGLSISAYQDWKTREVEDWVWIALLVIGIMINTFILWSTGDRLQVLATVTLSIIIAASLGFILWYLYLWGGGDLLVYISASMVAATLPIASLSPHSFEILPFCISALANAFLVTALLPGYLMLENTYRRFLRGDAIFHGLKASVRQKIFATLVGRPVNPTDLQSGRIKFYALLEEKRVEGWYLNFHSGRDEGALETHKHTTLEELEKEPKPYVWVHYTLPFLVPLTVGFIVTATYGTILFHLWFFLQAL